MHDTARYNEQQPAAWRRGFASLGIGRGLFADERRVKLIELIELQQQIVDRTKLGFGDVMGIEQLVKAFAPIRCGQNRSTQVPA
jgi:hypothetical protein